MKKTLLLTMLLLGVLALAATGCQNEDANTAAEPAAPKVAVAPEAAQPVAPQPKVEEPQGESGDKGNPAEALKENLANNTYVLINVNELPFASTIPQAPHLEFKDGLLIGGKICNNFRGKSEISENQLKMPDIAMTKMLCPEASRNDLERTMVNMLQNGVEFSFNESKLILKDKDTTLEFEVKKEEAVKTQEADEADGSEKNEDSKPAE